MKNGLTIDTANFNRAIRAMTALSGVDFETIVKAEVGSVLSATITNTKKATKASIDKSLQKWAFIQESSPAKHPQSNLSQGTAYLLMGGSRGAHRYPDYIWAWIQMNQEQRKKELVRRIGTAKKSWYLLAQRLKINLPKSVPGYVQKATVNGKELTGEVESTRKVTGSQVGFLIRNFTRAAISGGGRSALLKAINGRTGYFHRNLRSGAFKKVSTIAKKYPGFHVRGI
jgi:hypothetical protein